jgi:hypothetical protein
VPGWHLAGPESDYLLASGRGFPLEACAGVGVPVDQRHARGDALPRRTSLDRNVPSRRSISSDMMGVDEPADDIRAIESSF